MVIQIWLSQITGDDQPWPWMAVFQATCSALAPGQRQPGLGRDAVGRRARGTAANSPPRGRPAVTVSNCTSSMTSTMRMDSLGGLMSWSESQSVPFHCTEQSPAAPAGSATLIDGSADPSGFHLGIDIDAAGQWPANRSTMFAPRRPPCPPAPGVEGGHVRADDHVVQRQQRMIGRRRLDGQHVQAGAGQMSRLARRRTDRLR